MKKSLTKFIALSLFLFVTASSVNAQKSKNSGQNSIKRLGVNLAYGTEDLNLGFGARGEFSLIEKLTIAPKFNYYLGTSETISGIEISATGFTLDGDLHYYLASGTASFYALAGLSYATATASVASVSVSDSKAGINLGAGVVFSSEKKINPFAEVKYNSPFEAILINAGILFSLGK
jgi:hypothetical protein